MSSIARISISLRHDVTLFQHHNATRYHQKRPYVVMSVYHQKTQDRVVTCKSSHQHPSFTTEEEEDWEHFSVQGESVDVVEADEAEVCACVNGL